MKKLLLFLLIPLALAAKPSPTGSFEIAVSGYTVTATLSNMSHLTQNDEVTLGTTCVDATGTSLVMWDTTTNNAGHNPYILEVHWNGRWTPATFTVPSAAVVCQSELIAADWFKGEVLQAWVLDPWRSYPVGV